MFSIAVFLAASAATPAAGTNSLPDLFIAACLDGEVKLSASEVTALRFSDLPPALRERLGSPASADVWQLKSSGRSYLYVLNFRAGRGINPKICGLASDSMSLSDAADAMEVRIAGTMVPKKSQGIEWLHPKDGYAATATNAADFKVMQINWLSEEQRAEMLSYVAGLPE